MSRIHEALKKAAQERTAVKTSDVTASPSTTTEAMQTPAEADASADVIIPASHAAAIATAQSEYLRFDDLRTRCSHPRWNPDPNTNVFGNGGMSAQAAEQFRTLRSRLYQIRANQSLRTLLVTSSIPAEGKTFVANNLTQAIVRQPERRALIIDGDLRCARLHRALGAPVAPGLTEYLRGEVDELAIIQHGQEGNLCFIPSGKEVTNPSELLSNGRLKQLLDRVTPVFDWIIIDSPPCLAVADASILATLCDGVLLVVRAGSTPTEMAQKAWQELQTKNVMGVVLNAVDDAELHDSYYYRSYGYGHNGAKVLQG
jgi:protein-tyrosine kinase